MRQASRPCRGTVHQSTSCKTPGSVRRPHTRKRQQRPACRTACATSAVLSLLR